ncbi:Protein of unknown function [Nitrosomonas ureae]|uniref:DUF262 domain-containing protein n=1 Tax=Nitrosomonas ureae TaxID=44577 RepID=A0A285C0Z1_9PROT|nr:DUF262 domain-containing protein [Nitrosomonas ureae]SNX60703.1 Protein of unknown function [Nitrosomonas ureae]
MAIEGHQKNIRDLIMGDNMSFHIPIYQRTYTWQATKEVDKLINDIVEFLEEHEGNSKADYYIGNIIVKNQTRGFVTERVVIDGQQRITTTILILCAVRDIYLSKIKTENALESARAICRALFSQEGEHIRIKLNNMEHQRTLNTLLSGELQTIDLADRSTNYWKNYSHIFKRFDEWDEQQLQNFVDILGRVKVVVIFLDEEQDENSVFESINSAGKPLSGADLIKNFIFTFKRFQVSHTEEKHLIDLYTNKFEALFTDLAERENDIETFFREYLAVKTSEKVTKDPKVVHHAFKKWGGDIADFGTCKQLILDLIKWAIIYQTLRVNSHPDFDKNSLGYLRASFLTYATLLMDIVEKLSKIEEGKIVIYDKRLLNKAINKVVAYDACRFLSGDPDKAITRFIPTIPKKLEAQNSNYWHDYAAAFEKLVTSTTEGYRQPSVGLIERRITDINLYGNKKKLLRFLVLIENIDQNEVISFDTGLKGCQIEHIMPQTINGQWANIPESMHQQYLHTLGNLSLTFDNQGLSNKGFSEKKKLLAEKSRIRLNQILLDYDAFDELAIKDRARKILEKFFRGFSIERSDSDSDFEPIPAEITPKVWLENVRRTHDASSLEELINPQSWKSICDFLEIDVGQDSAHRRLEQWRKKNKPQWPSVF